MLLRPIVSLYTSVHTFQEHFKRGCFFCSENRSRDPVYSLFPQFTHRFHYAAVKVHCSLLCVLVKGTAIFTPENFSRGLNSRKFCVSTSIHSLGDFILFLFPVFFFFFFIIVQETTTFCPSFLQFCGSLIDTVYYIDYFTVSMRLLVSFQVFAKPFYMYLLFSLLFNVFHVS